MTNQGLAEDQVVAFVNDLLARYQGLRQQKESIPSVQAFSRQVLVEAEREAATLKSRAKRDAEVEAARIVAEARERAQGLVAEAKRRAEEITEKQVHDILLTARKKAELVESQASQLAQRFFIQAREDVQGQITSEVKDAYYRLLNTLQEMLTAGQNIEAEWKSKTLELWSAEPLQLEEYKAGLLDTSATGEFSPPTVQAEQPPEAAIPLEQLVGESPGQPEETPIPIVEEARAQSPAAEPAASVLAELWEEPVSASTADSQTAGPPGGEAVVLTREVRGQAQAEVVELTEQPQGEVAAPEAPSGPAVAAPPVAKYVHPDLYSGEVELVLAPPVDIGRLSLLHERLQGIPSLRVLRTAGSWDEGTVITILLENPMPVLSMLKAIPMVVATPVPPEGGGLLKTAVGPLADRGKRRDRIAITFEGQQETGDSGD